jgi:hypothetical protein
MLDQLGKVAHVALRSRINVGRNDRAQRCERTLAGEQRGGDLKSDGDAAALANRRSERVKRLQHLRQSGKWTTEIQMELVSREQERKLHSIEERAAAIRRKSHHLIVSP